MSFGSERLPQPLQKTLVDLVFDILKDPNEDALTCRLVITYLANVIGTCAEWRDPIQRRLYETLKTSWRNEAAGPIVSWLRVLGGPLPSAPPASAVVELMELLRRATDR